jgi:hypothetical protein
MNYQFRSYNSTHQPLFNEPITHSNEQFERLDLSGTVRIAQRWQLKTILPYCWNSQQKEGSIYRSSGLGDIQLSSTYFLVNRVDSTGKYRFRLALGGGVKLPTGTYTMPHDDRLILFPGTGTIDGLLHGACFLQRNKWSFSSEISAMIRGANQYHYSPGSVINTTLFAQRQHNNFSLFSGFQFARNGNDYLLQVAAADSPTKGSILSAVFGATAKWNQLVFQGNAHIPLYQSLGGGETTQKQAFNVSITYLL